MLGQLERPTAFDTAAGRAVVELGASGGVRVDPAVLERPWGSGCPVLDFASSGAMWITGEHAPVQVDFPMLARLHALCAGIGALSSALGTRVDLDPAIVIVQRAAERGFTRRGQSSANGSCRMIRCADTWVAFNLARPSDLELLCSVCDRSPGEDPWGALRQAGQESCAAELVERAQRVGVPAAVLDLGPPEGRRPAVDFVRLGRAAPATGRRLRVLDFSAMWAGPLCAHVLGRSVADVRKVEDPARPDGARVGDPLMYRRLHRGHDLCEVSFSTGDGRQELHRVVEEADVVIETSRPRALDQIGLSPKRFLANGEGRVWISITGYGRSGTRSDHVAFGDDAAVAGGLVAWSGPDSPVFCADAVADPISGLFAAFGGLIALAAGGGLLVDVSMSAASAAMRSEPGCDAAHFVEADPGGWWNARHEHLTQRVLSPVEVLTGAHG